MKNRFVEDIGFSSCALCCKSNTLCESHIIPSFVYRWLINTSATGYIRCGEVPNQRRQDGWKPKMLCEDCERKISAWEKYFADKCFYPIINRTENSIHYKSWMLKFATSVSWRVLRSFKAIGGTDSFPKNIQDGIEIALDSWKAFIMGERPNPGEHEQHLILADAVVSAIFADIPQNINRYLLRAAEIYVAHTADSAFTYAKLGTFILFGFIKMPFPRRWKGTKLNANEGRFGVGNIEIPLNVGEFIMNRAKRSVQRMKLISEKQQAKISETYRKSNNRVLKSGTLQAMQNDVDLFGESALDVFNNEN